MKKNSTLNWPFAPHVIAGAALLMVADISSAQTQNTTYSYQYDAVGNLTQVTDPLGRITKHTYDALNRRITSTDPNNGVTQYSYDGLDQLVKVVDPRSLATNYTIDGLGNQSALISPDTGTTSKTYDEAGNVKTSTDAKGQITSYQDDVLNRITQVTYADGSVVSYAYDQGVNGIGRLTQVTDMTGSIQYGYEVHGRITNETRTIGNTSYTTLYRYDGAGRLAGLTYPSGRTIDYTRDSLGRIAQINTTKDGVTLPIVTQVTYQPFGPAKAVTFGNNQTYARSYDLDGRIASYTLNNVVQAISYDAASRITAINDAANTANTKNYGYDVLDRLTSYLNPNSSLSYAYDAVGNRTSQVNGASTTNYSYGTTSNRLISMTGAQNAITTLDANGSILDNGTNQFTYDARGRMIAAVTPVGTVQYKINGLGQRVNKTTPTDSTVFHYDKSGKLIGESSGPSTTEYVYLDDMPVAVLK